MPIYNSRDEDNLVKVDRISSYLYDLRSTFFIDHRKYAAPVDGNLQKLLNKRFSHELTIILTGQIKSVAIQNA